MNGAKELSCYGNQTVNKSQIAIVVDNGLTATPETRRTLKMESITSVIAKSHRVHITHFHGMK